MKMTSDYNALGETTINRENRETKREREREREKERVRQRERDKERRGVSE